MKKSYFLTIAILLIIVIAIIVTRPTPRSTINELPTNSHTPSNFSECAAAGFPVGESYPRQCFVPNGPSFTAELPNVPPTSVIPPESSLNDLIQIITPAPEETVTSPLTVSGKARGNWYFEASFPVTLKDATGKTLVQTYAQAQDEWMTEEFVPFSLIITFPRPETETGTLILHKDNPSGLPEYDQELEIPVRFKTL